jgi:hypothetical protein
MDMDAALSDDLDYLFRIIPPQGEGAKRSTGGNREQSPMLSVAPCRNEHQAQRCTRKRLDFQHRIWFECRILFLRWCTEQAPVLAPWYIRTQQRQFSPSNFAGAIRLSPPSSQVLASGRKGMGVSITTTFPCVLQVPSAIFQNGTQVSRGRETRALLPGEQVESLGNPHEVSCLPPLPVLCPGATRVPPALLCYTVSVPTAQHR